MANPLVTRETIEAEVKKALAATLRIEEDGIDLSKSVVNELQATSIDFLDINFRLESTFGIQLATQLLLDHVEELLGEGVAIDTNNQITAPAAALLRQYFGDLPELKAGLYADEIPSLVTGHIVADGVEKIVEQLPAACGSCGKSEWRSEDGAKVTCGSCEAEAEYPDGDTLIQAWINQVEKDQQLFAGA